MNLADKTIINILAKSGDAVLLLLSSIVMVRSFSKSDYGTFLQIMLIMNTVIMLTYFGIPQSIYYFIHKTSNKYKFILNNLIIAVVLGLIAALIVALINPNLSTWLNNPQLSNYSFVIVGLILLRGPIGIREPLLISQEHLLVNSFLSILASTIFYVPIIIGALSRVTLPTLLIIMLIASFANLMIFFIVVLWLLHTIKKSGATLSKQNISLMSQLRYALPIGVSSYVGIIGKQIDQYIVSLFFSPQSYAVYSRGAMQIPILSSMQHSINDIMMPYYVKFYQKGDIKSLLAKYHLCIEKVAKIKISVFFFLFAMAHILMSLLYTKAYIDSVPIFRTYLFLLIINLTTFAIIPRVVGKTHNILYATLISVVINVILSCLLVPYFGPIGAAVSTIICILGSSIYYLFVSCKLLCINFIDIFPWRKLTKIIVASFLCSIPLFVLNFVFNLYNVNLFTCLFIDSFVYMLVWIYLFTRFHILNDEDFVTLNKWFKCDVEVIFRKIAFLNK